MKRFLWTLAVGVIGVATSFTAASDVLDRIEERGKIIVGVQGEYKPFGFTNPEGDIVGIEADHAQDVADALGVDVELVPVIASNRMQFLDQGKIDVIIAPMTDTVERREVVQFVNPDYYSSGTNILTRKSAEFDDWKDLDGVPVCGVQGAFYNRKTSQAFGAKIVGFTGTNEALNALRQGRCAAFVFDDSFFASVLQRDRWSDYKMPLETIDNSPWGIAVKQGEDRLARFMSGMVVHWHTTGRIIELEKKWGIDPIPFTKRMHELFQQFLPSEG